MLHNFDITGERVFKINTGMSQEIGSSEEAFFRMFYDVEYVVSCNVVKWRAGDADGIATGS